MPGEEGYPAYLSSRLAEYYERAGIVKTLGSEDKIGSITAISAVSPPGGDLSEPVSQATLRIVKVFWGLSASLAYKRHFPAIDWLSSYSLYDDKLSDWYKENVNENWMAYRGRALKILQEEANLDEIVRLVGVDALSPKDRMIMETAKSIREDYLHQDAFHEVDTYATLKKQCTMLKLILEAHDLAIKAIEEDVEVDDILELPAREAISRSKYIEESNLAKFEELSKQMADEIETLISEGEL